MNENPGAYNEARNRIREKEEWEKVIIEKQKEVFVEKSEKIRKRKKLDMFELKRRIETGQSLESLKHIIQEALKDGSLEWTDYRETLRKIESLESDEKEKQEKKTIPLSDNPLAQYFEKAPLWENIFVDFSGFFYGFFVQWSAILVILAWNIFLDTIFLPKDIYTLLKEKTLP